jgi:hypothetical protein
MKNLEPEAITQLLNIIPDHPATRIMHFSEGGEPLCRAIKELCITREYEYQLNILKSDFQERAQEIFAEKGVCSTKLIKWEQRRYATMARLYDFLFITATVPDEQREMFIKNVFPHIKSAGNIILFLPKEKPHITEAWWRVLEDNLFVAMNTIDIFEHYEILIAKKMHGWGGTH